MQSVLAILVLVCTSQVFCGTIVTFDQVQANPAQQQQQQQQQQQNQQKQQQQGVPFHNGFLPINNGWNGINSLKVESKNRNANLNDIRIGSGAGAGTGDDFKIPNFGWDTDEVKIDWDGKDSEECKAGSSTANPLADPTATTSTTTASTTTISPNCTCAIKSDIDANFGLRNCTFYADDAKAHCDQKGYSLKRAICVAALALNWEQCSPINATDLVCTCPILRLYREERFEIPWHVPPNSQLFYGARYKTCYRQCRESVETEESTYEESSDESVAQDTGKFFVPADKKKKL